MAIDVFISYPHQDKVTADAACATLEAAGVQCWIAPRDIIHGEDWAESIISALSEAKLMVLIFSAHANSSQQIKREVERAVNKGIPVIQFRIEGVLLSKSLEYFLSASHCLDAVAPPLENHLHSLVQSAKAHLRTGLQSMPVQSPAEAKEADNAPISVGSDAVESLPPISPEIPPKEFVAAHHS